jgi:hypothetical protein
MFSIKRRAYQRQITALLADSKDGYHYETSVIFSKGSAINVTKAW